MGDHLRAGGQSCRGEMLCIPVGFLDELESLLANVKAGKGADRSREAAQAFFDQALASMSLDEKPWGNQTAGGVVQQPRQFSAAGHLRFPKSGDCAEVVYDPGYWGGAFGEAEAKLAVACADALGEGKPLPKWGAKRVPSSAETRKDHKSSPTLSNSWWSFKLFGPWAARYWMPYPAPSFGDPELGEPASELIRGALALRSMAPTIDAALPWIKKASKLYEASVFPMLALAPKLSLEIERAVEAVPKGSFAACSEREALMAKFSALEGYALYCDGSGDCEAGFVGMGEGEGHAGDFGYGLPAGSAAMFATVQNAKEFAHMEGIDVAAVVKLGVRVMGVEARLGAVDASIPQEMAALGERSEMLAASQPRSNGSGTPPRKAKAASRL